MDTPNPDPDLLRLAQLREAKPRPASVNGFIDDVGTSARGQLASVVEVETIDHIPTLAEMFVEKKKWLRVEGVVALSADLKDSTALSLKNKYVNTSARLYEAATGAAVRIVAQFNPGFIDIQGDGLFALFHGDAAVERAICAGVTLKTFSARELVPSIEELFDDRFPHTGFKIGMDCGILAVKKVGVRGTNEPVWAGKPVNWATKCASHADRHELVVTAAVYSKISDNEYITHSCGCGSELGPQPLWDDTTVEPLDEHAQCKILTVGWCPIHGDDFCNAVLDGERQRDDVARSTWAA